MSSLRTVAEEAPRMVSDSLPDTARAGCFGDLFVGTVHAGTTHGISPNAVHERTTWAKGNELETPSLSENLEKQPLEVRL